MPQRSADAPVCNDASCDSVRTSMPAHGMLPPKRAPRLPAEAVQARWHDLRCAQRRVARDILFNTLPSGPTYVTSIGMLPIAWVEHDRQGS